MIFKNYFLNKVAIVTGASSGIGRATALALASQGTKVALAARRIPLLEEVAAEIRAMNVEALVIPTDVTRQAQIDQMVGQALHQWGKIDILVSNAGEYIRSPIENLSDQDLQRSMEVNFFAGVHAIQAVLPHMRGQKSGHIIAVTSMDGRLGVPPDAPYASAKFALTGFLEVLRQELHRSGIHVCNVMPGRVDTAMIENLKFMWVSRKIPPEAVASKILKAIEKRTPVVMLPPGAALLFYVNAFSPTISDFLTRHLRLEGWQ